MSANVKRALVVEDEPGIASVCSRILTGEGFLTEIAVNGKVALDMVKEGKNRYDLCLIDIRTPQMNGVELYQHLEEEYPGAVDKIIFTTGDVMSGNLGQFLERVNRPYLPKPFTPAELKAVVRKAMDGR